jgi:hypothetical protein
VTDKFSLPDPPAANQDKPEPEQTQNPDNDGSMPASTSGGVPTPGTPGDSKGVAVPSVQAAAGTSEESGAIQDVRTTSLAPPGKPDGEVDTRA